MPHMDSQNPDDWGWAYGDGAHIVPFAWRGHDFAGGVAAGTSPLWVIALDLIDAEGGWSIPDGPATISGCWGFERRLKSSGSDRSFHGWGLALDICAPWNGRGQNPPPASPHRVPITTGMATKSLGFLWGGDFSGVPDWMHLELHLSPREVDEMIADHSGAGRQPLSGLGVYPLPDGYYYGPYSGPTASISGSGHSDGPYRAGLRSAQRALGVADDGYYGPVTAAAAAAYQYAHSLAVDGLIGPATWRSLGGQ